MNPTSDRSQLVEPEGGGVMSIGTHLVGGSVGRRQLSRQLNGGGYLPLHRRLGAGHGRWAGHGRCGSQA